MSYASEKHEPKTMKAKADLMLKKGSISEKQHKKLHAKADVEIGKMPKGTPSEAEVSKQDPPEGDADATETKKKRKAAIKDDVMRGQPDDQAEKDQ